MAVGIIDYGMGNLRSVSNAIEALGSPVVILSSPDDLPGVDRVVLPGVGAFGDGMAKLDRGGWIPVLREEVLVKGKPFLGLCLGMQLLATLGTEHGECAGLGWIPGAVRRLESVDPAVRIPHIGWNDVEVVRPSGLYRGYKGVPVFYFVHSYVFQPEDPAVISGYCQHGVRFAASVEWNNVFATQYHPEKSQKSGLTVLRNFLQL
jgi:glutamine amidotransferase